MVPVILAFAGANVAFFAASKQTPLVGTWIVEKRHALVAKAERGLVNLEQSNTAPAGKTESLRADLNMLREKADSGWVTPADWSAFRRLAAAFYTQGHNSFLDTFKFNQ